MNAACSDVDQQRTWQPMVNFIETYPIAGVFLSIQSTALVDLLSVAEFPKAQGLLGTFIGLSALFVAPFAGVSALYESCRHTQCMVLVCSSSHLSLSSS